MIAFSQINIGREKVPTFRNVFLLGLAVAFFVTFSEFLRGKHFNFMIFTFTWLFMIYRTITCKHTDLV